MVSVEERQVIWDALLVQAWRRFDTVGGLRQAFGTAVPGEGVFEGVLRTPGRPARHGTAVRAWVAGHLPKISARLWAQPPEADAALLRKLATSKYTTLERAMPDRDLDAERRALRQNVARNEYTTRIVSDRNERTNWGVCK